MTDSTLDERVAEYKTLPMPYYNDWRGDLIGDLIAERAQRLTKLNDVCLELDTVQGEFDQLRAAAREFLRANIEWHRALDNPESDIASYDTAVGPAEAALVALVGDE